MSEEQGRRVLHARQHGAVAGMDRDRAGSTGVRASILAKGRLGDRLLLNRSGAAVPQVSHP
jgi:hypothetical protein